MIYFHSKLSRVTRGNFDNAFDGRSRCFMLESWDHGKGRTEVCVLKIFILNGSIKILIFRCLGSTQHLKNLYGAGYNLEIKLKQIEGMTNSSSFENIQLHAKKQCRNFVNELFPDSRVEESFGDRIVCSIPQHNVSSLAQSFESLEKGEI